MRSPLPRTAAIVGPLLRPGAKGATASMETLRARLRAASEDDRITRAEVESLIRAALADGTINEMEELFLGAAKDVHAALFEPDALQRLTEFLASAPKSPR